MNKIGFKIEKELFVLVICGSRNFTDYSVAKSAINQVLSKQITLGRKICLISGGARGADKLAERYARETGFPIKVYPADWSQGKSAGFRRNELMHKIASHYEHRGCLAFVDNESRGTKHSIKCAKQHNTPVRVYQVTPTEEIELA